MMKRFFVATVLTMTLVMLASVVYAAGTPDWWDNPDGYTSWNGIILTGNAANNSGNSQSLFIFNDNVTCTVGATRELWMQISWVNTGSPDVTLRGQSASRAIEWTEDPAGCPANVTLPLPSEDGDGVLTNQDSFSPTGNSVPSNLPFTDGYERSFSFADTNATCARTTTAFDIPDGGGFEYQIEIQTLCFNPTAVTLQSLGMGGNSNRVTIGLIAALAALLLVTSLIMARRQMVVREVEL